MTGPLTPTPKLMSKRLIFLLAGLIALACEGTIPAEPSEMRLTCTNAFPSAPDDLFGLPLDIVTNEAGEVFVADPMSNRIHRFSASGVHVTSFGQEGAGPGEFDRLGSLAVGNDLLQVVDRGNGRLQILTPTGEYVGSRSLPPRADRSGTYLGSSGEMVVGTRGAGEALVVTYDSSGDSIRAIGEPVAPFIAMWDMVAMKERARDGEVPDEIRNTVSPQPLEDGGMVLVLAAEGRVRRYDPSGSLAWDVPLEDPALEGIRADFVRRNREDSRPFAFFSLNYVDDIVAREDFLWILLNTPEGVPSLLLRWSDQGTLSQRIVLTNVFGARRMAFDPSGSRLYLTVPNEARVMVCPLN